MLRRALTWLLCTLLGLAALSLLWVGSYRVINPPSSFLLLRDRID